MEEEWSLSFFLQRHPCPSPPRGGTLAGLDSLYQEIILDHYRKRRNRGEIQGATATVEQNNPVCGDAITLQIRVDGDRLDGLGYTGDGCSISQASASMMSEVVIGRTTDEAEALIEHMRRVMHGDEEPDEERLGDAVALGGVAKFPARIKCALLSWMALKDAIETDKGGSHGD